MAEIYSDKSAVDGKKLLNEKAVEKSLDNIVIFDKFDIPFNPIGASIENYLFKPVIEATAQGIYFRIISEVSKIDDRIIINNQVSSVSVNDNVDGYDVALSYSIRGLIGSFIYRRAIKSYYNN